MTKATVRAIASRTVGPTTKRTAQLPILAETAHDLNNALTAIRVHLDLLALDTFTLDCSNADKVRQRLLQLQPAVQHAAEISRQLMSPESLSSSHANHQPRRTALNPVLQRMVPILSAMLPPRVDLHLRLDPDLRLVSIDPVHVVRIVSNLVLNSCAALGRDGNQAGGETGGTVTIETAHGRLDGWVVLRVRDTGSGMSDTTRTNLFRPFFTTKPRPESAGLGLASVLRMVRRAGGTIQIESGPGQGTEVAILLPPAASRDKKKPPGSLDGFPTPGTSVRNPGPTLVNLESNSRPNLKLKPKNQR